MLFWTFGLILVLFFFLYLRRQWMNAKCCWYLLSSLGYCRILCWFRVVTLSQRNASHLDFKMRSHTLVSIKLIWQWLNDIWLMSSQQESQNDICREWTSIPQTELDFAINKMLILGETSDCLLSWSGSSMTTTTYLLIHFSFKKSKTTINYPKMTCLLPEWSLQRGDSKIPTVSYVTDSTPTD